MNNKQFEQITIEPLHFGEAEIKPALRDKDDSWNIYISQDRDGILTSNCWSVTPHCYDTEEGLELVRVYEGLNKDIAYGVNNKVYENNHKLYDKLGVLSEGKTVFDLSDEERVDLPTELQRHSGTFRESARKLITDFDLELLVDGAKGTPLSQVREEYQARNYTKQAMGETQ